MTPLSPTLTQSSMLAQLQALAQDAAAAAALTPEERSEALISIDRLKELVSSTAKESPVASSCAAPSATGDEQTTESQCTTSESESDGAATTTHSRSRPSAKARARLRRQLQAQQQQQQQELGVLAAAAAEGVLNNGPPQHQQWHAWSPHPQTRWQPGGLRYGQENRHQPLPGLLEQQEQHFRESLWDGRWVVAPVLMPMPPQPTSHPMSQYNDNTGSNTNGNNTNTAQPPRNAALAPARDEETFCLGMWAGSWQMVEYPNQPPPPPNGRPNGHGTPPPPPPPQPPQQQPNGHVSHDEASGEEETGLPGCCCGSSEPHHANINTTGGNYDKSSGKMMMIGLSGAGNTSCTATTGVMRERVRRCLRVYRWQRMQGVWTEWMREPPQAGAPATSLS